MANTIDEQFKAVIRAKIIIVTHLCRVVADVVDSIHSGRFLVNDANGFDRDDVNSAFRFGVSCFFFTEQPTTATSQIRKIIIKRSTNDEIIRQEKKR